jgi:hypothetical protein
MLEFGTKSVDFAALYGPRLCWYHTLTPGEDRSPDKP